MKLDISNKISEKIELSDLSSDLQYLAEVIGLDLVRELIVQMGGTGNPIYIPDTSSFDKAIHKMLEVDFPGKHLRDVSYDTGISLRRLKSINKKYKNRNE